MRTSIPERTEESNENNHRKRDRQCLRKTGLHHPIEDCIQPLMAMSKCAAPEIEPVDIDVTDTVAFTWEIQ